MGKQTIRSLFVLVALSAGLGALKASAMGSKNPSSSKKSGSKTGDSARTPANDSNGSVTQPENPAGVVPQSEGKVVIYNKDTSHKLPARPSCVVEVKQTIRVTGTLDGKGCLYTWRGAGYPQYCSAPSEIDENQPAMFHLEPGAMLKNLQMECALDGIHTTRNNTIDNIVNRDVEEDAITIGQNITIQNSQFWYCNDKCLQMNSADNVIIRNNRFYNSNKPVLANWGYNILVHDNYFKDVKLAIRSKTTKSYVKAWRNVVDGADCYLKAESDGYIEDFEEATLRNVKQKYCYEDGGKIVRK
jgi:hypothetical protein